MNTTKSEFIYKGPNSQVLLFTMKSGDYLKSHRATVDVLITVANGSMGVEAGEKQFVVNQGDHVLFDANTKHAVRAIEDLRFYLIKLAPHG